MLQVKYALSCSSGTAALHLAYEAIKLKKNDIVVMPAINFIAAYSMAKKLGARVILADVNPDTGQMTPETLINTIKKNKIKRIKAIVTMYLGGYPENVYEFYKIKKKFKSYLIEDACHALGAKYEFNKKNISVGSCKHSDICTFSMHPVKTITSGEGGIITTNKIGLYKRILLLRSHGIVKKNHWSYEVKSEGYNYRLSDINCALAISQLIKITKFINFRKKIFNFYNKNLVDNYFINPSKFKNIKFSSFHLFIIKINFDMLKENKDFLIDYMLKKKIILQFHYKPIFLFKDVFKQKFNINDFKGSMKYYSSFVSLPIFFKLSERQLLNIVKNVKTFIRIYSK